MVCAVKWMCGSAWRRATSSRLLFMFMLSFMMVLNGTRKQGLLVGMVIPCFQAVTRRVSQKSTTSLISDFVSATKNCCVFLPRSDGEQSISRQHGKSRRSRLDHRQPQHHD